MKRVLCLAMVFIMMCPIIVFAAPVDRISTPLNGYNLTTPPANVFRLLGDAKEFIILDVEEATGNFFVYAKDFYGQRIFDPDDTAKFDIDDPNNIAYFLNNEFIKIGNLYNGSTYKLPDKILEYIDYDHVWITEGGASTTDYTEDFETKAGIVVLSQTEWRAHITKFGTQDGATEHAAWLRSARGRQVNPASVLFYRVSAENGITNSHAATKSALIRPAFYLKRKFFLKEKLNVSSMGDNVKVMLRNNLTRDELSRVYSPEEIKIIYGNLSPQATNILTVGRLVVGNTLTGYYTYKDPEGDMERNTGYRWYSSESLTSAFRYINGTNGIEYTLRPEDVGKYLCFEVTPKNAYGIGVAVKSPVIGPISDDTPPVLDSVSINGTGVVNEELTIEYSYFDAEFDKEDGTEFIWYISDTKDGEYEIVKNAEGKRYTPISEDYGKYIKCAVTPKSSGFNKEGETYITEPIGAIMSKPVANNIMLKKTGDAINASYDFNDIANHKDSGSEYIWQVGASENGYYFNAEGGNGLSYKIKPSDAGKYIRLAVIPRKNEAPKSGDIAYSLPVLIEGGNEYHESDVDVLKQTSDGKAVFTIKASDVSSAYSCEFEVKYNKLQMIYSDISPKLFNYDSYTDNADTRIYKKNGKTVGLVRVNNTGDVISVIITKTGEIEPNNGNFDISELSFDVVDNNSDSVLDVIRIRIASIDENGHETVILEGLGYE